MRTSIVSVPVSRKNEYIKLIEKINIKALKFGKKPIVYTFDSPEIESYKDEQTGETFSREVYPFTLEIEEEIKIDGWNVLAIIKVEHGIRTFHPISNDSNMNPLDYENVPETRCDHCHSERSRNIQFVLEHTDGKEYVVGSTCVKDFTGIDPKSCFNWIKSVEELEDFEKETHYFKAYPIDRILGIAFHVINTNGYTKGDTINCIPSTRDIVIDWIETNKTI